MKKTRRLLFLFGGLLGAVCFLWIYGVRVLDPTYDDWIFHREPDLIQHYVGFCHYRTSAWQFPVGLIDSLSYPTKVSMIYTDSIPIFALVFKLFDSVLPLHFQYFGLFGFISFILMGSISAIFWERLLTISLIEKNFTPESTDENSFLDKHFIPVISIILSVIFILGFLVLDRMFYHTALGAQWIIVLSLYIWISRHSYSKKKTIVIYALMGLLCVLVHTYFIAMVGSILLIASVEACFRNKKDIKHEILNIFSYCAAGLLALYIFGGFYGQVKSSGHSFGRFSANLNTFFNPLYGSAVLKPLPMYIDDQYEGYAYLGLGVIIALVVTLVFLFRAVKKEGFRSFFKAHKRMSITCAVLMVDFLLAVLPTVAFGEKKILVFEYPQTLANLFGIFRSNGRFIWVLWYVFVLGAILFLIRGTAGIFGKKKNGKKMVILLVFLLSLTQVLDAFKVVISKQEYFKSIQEYESPWEQVQCDVKSSQYDEYVFLFNDVEMSLETAYYAYLHGKKVNNFYYARNISDQVNANIAMWKQELSEGIVRDNVVYILRKTDYKEGLYEGLVWYDLDETHLIGVKGNGVSV